MCVVRMCGAPWKTYRSTTHNREAAGHPYQFATLASGRIAHPRPFLAASVPRRCCRRKKRAGLSLAGPSATRPSVDSTGLEFSRSSCAVKRNQLGAVPCFSLVLAGGQFFRRITLHPAGCASAKENP
jgi:hypothetical protein